MEIEIEKITLSEKSTIRDAMKSISAGKIGVALLVENKSNRFISVITDGDIRRALLSGFGLQSTINIIDKIKNTSVKVGTPLLEVAQLFSEKIRVVPVIDDNHQVVDLHFNDKRKHIAVAKPFFDDNEIELVNECMVSGWVSSGGRFVKQFESMVAKHTGVKHAISCSSGTSALHLILLSYGIGVGDEVIVPSLTFIATANAVTYTGATPVFVDSDVETWNIDPVKIEDLITEKTKAIIPVHLYGHPADMDPINKIAKKYNIRVIEDAAEAQGASYKEKMVGSLADSAMFSFFGNKVVTTGEGGMIVTNDTSIADKCRLLRDHGMTEKKRYWHNIVGYNYRMTNLQAALGVAQMRKIDDIVSRKKWIASVYAKYLYGIKGITLPPDKKWADSVFWLFTILINEKQTNFTLEDLIVELKRNGIDARTVFYPVHTQPIYRDNIKLPISEEIHNTGISLPSAPDMTERDIYKVSMIISDLYLKCK